MSLASPVCLRQGLVGKSLGLWLIDGFEVQAKFGCCVERQLGIAAALACSLLRHTLYTGLFLILMPACHTYFRAML